MIKLEDNTTIMAFRERLNPSRFVVSLYNEKPKTLVVVMQKAYKEMEVEDILEEKYREIRSSKTLKSKNF